MNSEQVSGLIRHTLTTAGGAGLAVAEDDLARLGSALAVILGILWSWWVKRPRPE